MSDEMKITIVAALSGTCIFMSVVLAIAWYNISTTKAAIEAGYQQQTLRGQNGVYWVKPEEVEAE